LSFDRSSGEGLIRLSAPHNQVVDIYACNLVGKKTWYPYTACVFYEVGMVIEVKAEVFCGGKKVFFTGLTPATFDAAKWDRLDQGKGLAFKCDEEVASCDAAITDLKYAIARATGGESK